MAYSKTKKENCPETEKAQILEDTTLHGYFI